MFNKLIHLMLFCTIQASTTTRKAITHIYNTLTKTITSTPNAISNWIDKPHIWYTNNWHKTSHSGGKYSNNLCVSKNSWYNKRNCEFGKHSQRHTFMKHKSWTELPTTNSSNLDLRIKSKNLPFPNLHFLEDVIKYFVLSVVAKTAEILMTMINTSSPMTSPTYVTVTYLRSKVVPTGFPLTFLDIVF